MPTATNHGTDVYYERAGSGEAVVLVPTLGYGPWQLSWQFPALAGPFEAIAPTLRGTPRPATTGDGDRRSTETNEDGFDGSLEELDGPPNGLGGPLDVETLAADIEAVLADADVRRAHLVGIGLGGHVALEHAARYDRARSLALLAATPGAPEGDLPEDVVEQQQAPRDDPTALRSSLSATLSEPFRDRHPDVVDGIVEWRAEEDADRAVWDAQAAAFEDWERDWPPYEVTEPTLVVHGTADEVVPPSNADALSDLLPEATVERYEGAGHLVGVERSRPVNDRLLGFLERHADSAEH